MAELWHLVYPYANEEDEDIILLYFKGTDRSSGIRGCAKE